MRPSQCARRYDRTVPESEVMLPKGIGAPATRALVAAGYTHLAQLAGVTPTELERLHAVGPKAIRVLQEALEAEGKSLTW